VNENILVLHGDDSLSMAIQEWCDSGASQYLMLVTPDGGVLALEPVSKRAQNVDRLKRAVTACGLVLPPRLRDRRWQATCSEELHDLRDKWSIAGRAKRAFMLSFASLRLAFGFLHMLVLYLAKPIADLRKLLK
jgi:hypothetical protein